MKSEVLNSYERHDKDLKRAKTRWRCQKLLDSGLMFLSVLILIATVYIALKVSGKV